MSPAPFVNRAGAMAVDLLASLLPFALMFPVVLLMPGSETLQTSFLARIVFLTSLPAALFFYYALRIYCVSRERPTPGQKIFHLEVVLPDERRTRTVFIRFLLLGLLPMAVVLFSGLWPLFLLPVLLPLLTRSGGYPADLLLRITVTRPDPERA